jgi:hypothetical protein
MGIFKNEDDNIKKYLYLYNNESNFTLVIFLQMVFYMVNRFFYNYISIFSNTNISLSV